ncbi:MAG: hypothetical protein ACRELT_16015 [Longimicrobiales bacterium]
MSKSQWSGWPTIAIAAAGMLGWALLVIFMFDPPDWLTSEPPRQTVHPVYEPATIEGPPVIVLRHLRERGFDGVTLEQIEPHFHVLNAALVTIVELKEKYEAATFDVLRSRLRGEAVYFHTTADKHEEQIERLLPEDLSERFHAYIREREAAAGLHQDTVWHRHDNPMHQGVSPGFDTAVHDHSDSFSSQR